MLVNLKENKFSLMKRCKIAINNVIIRKMAQIKLNYQKEMIMTTVDNLQIF